MRKSIVLTLIAVLAALVAVPANAAEATQEDVCVWDGETGTKTKKANVVAIGDPVPGEDGKVFNENCVPVTDEYLVKAIRLDGKVIAGLEDQDGNKYPSKGDKVVFFEYPTGFDGQGYQPFPPSKTCVVDSATVNLDQKSVRATLKGDPDCTIGVVYWTKTTVPGQEHERFGVRYANDTRAIDLIDCKSFLKKDWVSVDGTQEPVRNSTSDDEWLHVVFDF